MRWWILAVCVACGDSGGGDGTTAAGCDACGDDEVCVSYLGGDDDHDECAAIPADCGGTASCDDTCRGALYDLCDETGWYGVGCSDTIAPVIVSCNPS
jgi:hypothetical protein